ncbi:MAG: hypothetical protein ABI613_08075 [Gemmatimonadota bacterium]
MADLVLRPLSVGEIIDHAFAIYRRQFATLFLITLLANALPLLMTMYVMTSGGIMNHPFLYFLNSAISLALGNLAIAATVFLVSEGYLGRSVTAGDAFGRAVKYIWPLVLLSFATGLIVVVGFFLLIVPCFIAISGLILGTPSLVLEDITPSAALSRSWNLTKGFRWKMFGLLVILVIIIAIPSIAISFLDPSAGAAGLMGQASTQALVWIVLQQLATILVYPLLYCALTIAYYDLRVRKEGFDLELLESTLAHALPPGGSSDLRDIPNSRTFG